MPRSSDLNCASDMSGGACSAEAPPSSSSSASACSREMIMNFRMKWKQPMALVSVRRLCAETVRADASVARLAMWWLTHATSTPESVGPEKISSM